MSFTCTCIFWATTLYPPLASFSLNSGKSDTLVRVATKSTSPAVVFRVWPWRSATQVTSTRSTYGSCCPAASTLK